MDKEIKDEELIYFEGYCNIEKMKRKFLQIDDEFAVCCSCPYRGKRKLIEQRLNELKSWEI